MNNCPRQDPAYRPTHLITRKPHLERDAVFLFIRVMNYGWHYLFGAAYAITLLKKAIMDGTVNSR